MTVNFEDIGYRGLAVKKTEGMFSMYLLDFGGSLVNVAPGQLRPLPPSLNNPLAVMYEVCLVGMGPIEGEVWGEEGWQLDLGIDLSGEIWMETKADGGEWFGDDISDANDIIAGKSYYYNATTRATQWTLLRVQM